MMKIERTKNGNILIIDENNNPIHLLPAEQVIYPHATDSNMLMFGKYWNDLNAVAVHVPSVSEIQNTAFNGTRNELILEMDAFIAKKSQLSGDYITTRTNLGYQLQQDYADPLEVQIIQTTITGNEVKRDFFKTRVVSKAALDALWASTLNEETIFDNLINL